MCLFYYTVMERNHGFDLPLVLFLLDMSFCFNYTMTSGSKF